MCKTKWLYDSNYTILINIQHSAFGKLALLSTFYKTHMIFTRIISSNLFIHHDTAHKNVDRDFINFKRVSILHLVRIIQTQFIPRMCLRVKQGLRPWTVAVTGLDGTALNYTFEIQGNY